MLGTDFYPSAIEQEIYDRMEDYTAGCDLYYEVFVDVVANYFTKEAAPRVKEWLLNCSSWPDESGGVCAVSWIELDNHMHMVMFDYVK